MLLSEIISDKIHELGPISFHDFMEMALYYPGLGYYTSEQDQIGDKGDFYTSSSTTPAFGTMIGRQFEEMWRFLGEGPFTIVEYGAGTGLLCHDILNYLKSNEQLYRDLKYCIIEKSPAMRAKERAHLSEKVYWFDSIAEMDGLRGCIFSNELLDNFAIHQVVMEDQLMEVFVDYEGGFVERLMPANPELINYLAELEVKLPKGFRTEINLEATRWIREITDSLHSGYVMTIDYGYPSAELYRSYRSSGTLVCYRKHKVNDSPYTDIGSQDITSHVNFSAVQHWGAKYGLELCGFTDQARFLMSLGILAYFEQEKGSSNKNKREEDYLQHILLTDMGKKFKVMVQKKAVNHPPLTGLKFSNPYALGMHSYPTSGSLL